MVTQDSDDPVLACIEATLKAVCGADRAAAASVLCSLDVEYLKRQREKRLSEVSLGIRAAVGGSLSKPRRRSISPTTRLAVFSRDSHTCRFCGLRTIDVDVLRALSKLFPVHLPYHRNWKFEATSLVYWTHATSLEHIVPLARGGADEPSNYATTCYACNDTRGDFLLEEVGWQLLPPTEKRWDGFRSWLPRLHRVASEPNPGTA